MITKRISPSLICMDLCNLEKEIRSLEALGCDMLHIDIIDGIYSPDMPLGISTVKQLRKCTDMTFDAHLMAANNAPYVDLLLECGVDRLCFHTEFEPRPSILLRKIRAAGKAAGIAISPETPTESLRYLFPLCDFLLFMRIDAGYAHLPGQSVYPQTEEKLKYAADYRKAQGQSLEIEVDGRVGAEDISGLLKAGADTFVSGSAGLFDPARTREQNWAYINSILNNGEA